MMDRSQKSTSLAYNPAPCLVFGFFFLADGRNRKLATSTGLHRGETWKGTGALQGYHYIPQLWSTAKALLLLFLLISNGLACVEALR